MEAEEHTDDPRVPGEPCPDCGHDTASIPTAHLAAALAEVGRQWATFVGAVLDHPGGLVDLRRRPAPQIWAAVEYACHVRDVMSIFARRVELTLLAECPEYGWWDHEAAVLDDHYAEQDPAAVADDIVSGTLEFAALIQPLGDAAMQRGGTRLGQPITVAGLVRFALHEGLHHLGDARAVVPAPSQ